MCLNSSVGHGGSNLRADVKTVQILINMNLGQLIPFAPLATDGQMGRTTYAAISEYQRRVLRQPAPDGRIDPGGSTLRRLRAGIDQTMFSPAKLQGIMITATAANVARFYTPLLNTMGAYAINTPLRMAHFLAQLAHESADLFYTTETSTGDQYEGRTKLGNSEPGDGRRFKGRGLIQLTGRTNYTAYGAACGEDFTTDATAALIATDPERAADVSGWFWSEHGLNKVADLDDINAATKLVNGAVNGPQTHLDLRKAKLARAKFFLGL